MDGESSRYDLLEGILLDESAPTNLPMWLLESITNNFSDDQKIGSGGFADVYKGLLPNGGAVAVKKLKLKPSEMVGVHETKFNQEVYNLMKVKHKNIVRFLGYCSDTQGKVWEHDEGKNIMVEERQRFLCFEFVPGSLDKYINDASEGLEWRTRYQIIKGICEGLHYLHLQKIVHSDLKTANVLLDHNMMPKIADFGGARSFGEEQTKAITSNVVGTRGYMAPEFVNGTISLKSDIYSLGVIITEILTGRRGCLQIEKVLESWNARFQTSQRGTWLEHVRVCAEIGLECMEHEPENRPTIKRIIEILNGLEKTYGFIETDLSAQNIINSTRSSDFLVGKLLDVYPLELRLPFEPNKLIKSPVTLTNKTDGHVGVWIARSGLGVVPYLWEEPGPGQQQPQKSSSVFCMLRPHSTKVVYMTMTTQQQPPPQADTGIFQVVIIAMESEEALRGLGTYLISGISIHKFEDLVKTVKRLGTEVHRATLRASVTCDPAWCQEVVGTHQFIPGAGKSEFIECIDVHPTETWMLMGQRRWYGYVSIWNYETREKVMAFKVAGICATKFIPGEKWFAAGDENGSVHVYSYTSQDKVKEFQAHHPGRWVELLSVHPTDRLLLTANKYDGSIKLWDWGQGWTCTRVFVDQLKADIYKYVTFGPTDTNISAISSGLNDVKVWDIHSSDPIATFKGTKHTFYTDSRNNWHFVVTTSGNSYDYGANIWDLRTKQHVHTLHHLESRNIYVVASHPTLPILAIVAGGNSYGGSGRDRCLYLWDTKTYRLKKRVEFCMDDPISMVFNGTDEDLTRIAVASCQEILTIKINFSALWTGGEN
ncbi:unnamed protein product [Urochloa decumbens]|uniref:Protein kinase domain-containing protein n=1 Tax=Urochloa decumbens TaxID=240449 RepID=A0ABC9AZA1_9POAL